MRMTAVERTSALALSGRSNVFLISVETKQTKGSSINDVMRFGIIFDPLPPPSVPHPLKKFLSDYFEAPKTHETFPKSGCTPKCQNIMDCPSN